MILDKNGKIGGKISIIDIAAILLVIVVAAGIVMRYGNSITAAVESDKLFEYTVRVASVRSYTVTALEKKGKITDKRSEQDLGEITDVKTVDAEFQSTTADGNIVETNLPDRYTCLVTIQARGKESEDGYIMNDTTELSVGRSVDIYSKYVKTSGEIMSVKVVE